jgi:hypothetical protein
MVAGPSNAYLARMGFWRSKAFIAALAIFALGQVDLAQARAKKEHAYASAGSGVPSIMVDVDASGTPIIMRGLPAPTKPSLQQEHQATKRAERPRRVPRGSSAYVGPIPLPRTGGDSGIAVVPAVTPYIPPPINTFSDRVTKCLHSFPLNAGLGNNPTERDFYVRSCANR